MIYNISLPTAIKTLVLKKKIKLLFIFLIAIGVNNKSMSQEKNKYNQLTDVEKNIIINKGTEAPFTGLYNSFYEKGTYICKRCNTPLYKSQDKFNSNCGWPSFDDEIKGAVKRLPDADGRRTEILCNNCGAHLGHVFIGEGFTDKNTRHCVNSISLNFIPFETEILTETAIFAGGCFWGVEYYFNNVKGVNSTEVGYIGGDKDNPTYEEVCAGTTGHIEAIKVVFDPRIVKYEELCKLFFEIHDPGQLNRQGPDIGEQYKSAIFYTSNVQKEISIKLINILKEKGYSVVTELIEASKFWPAENYHQDYYDKKGDRPYCHFYKKKF